MIWGMKKSSIAIIIDKSQSSCSGVEYVPGEYKSLVGDLVGVILQGVSEDDGEFLDVFLHDPNEFGGEFAILLGDLNLDLVLSLT